MNQKYTYQEALGASEKIHWRVEDLIGGDKRLDFTKPSMPESLARVEQVSYLTPEERRTLNQIRGNAYLCIFGLVEEFILPFVLDHARLQLHSDDYRLRALLQFAGEEAKHIHLFKRFREDFESGFGTACAVIGPPEAIASAVLAHDPLAVALVILHIEWMTQRHYIDSSCHRNFFDLSMEESRKKCVTGYHSIISHRFSRMKNSISSRTTRITQRG